MSEDVLLVSPAPDAGGVGQYAEQLADVLDSAVLDRVFLDRLAGLRHFLERAISISMTDADVVHIQHVYGLFGSKSVYMWLFFPIASAILKMRGRALVLTVHEVWTQETVSPPLISVKVAYIRIVNWALGKFSSRVVFLSSSAASTFDPSPSATDVIPHGVDTETSDIDREQAREQFGFESDDVVVGQFGYINRRKGPDIFVELARKSDNWEFLLAGGPRKTEVEPFYDELLADAPDNLIATGVLDGDTFNAAFVAADIAVLPYREITQSGIFNRCAAYGLPVVASDVPYFSELAKTYSCVATFPVGNVAAAHDVVDGVIADEQRQKELIVNINRYTDRHSFKRVADSHRELYAEVST